jgi:hypothetical protein
VLSSGATRHIAGATTMHAIVAQNDALALVYVQRARLHIEKALIQDFTRELIAFSSPQ